MRQFSVLFLVSSVQFISAALSGNFTVTSSPNPNLLQKYRPPEQSYIQQVVNIAGRTFSQYQSQNAYESVKQLMQNLINSGELKDIDALKWSSATDLMNLMYWEFTRLPLFHTIPLTPEDAGNEYETDFITAATNGYVHNVFQRYIMGVESRDTFKRESQQAQEHQNVPLYYNSEHPTLREANDGIIRLANNWLKTQAGSSKFGSFTLVINNIYQDKMIVSPCEGATCLDSWTTLGTTLDFWHIMQPFLTYTAQDAGLSKVFHRWYNHQKVYPYPSGVYPAFEVGFIDNLLLPDSLHYAIISFNGVWGTEDGAWVQNWMWHNKRALIWSNGGDDSGMLIDPTVNWVSGPGGYISQSMVDQWKSQWKNTKLKFSELYSASSDNIKFRFREYFTSDSPCSWYENNGYNVMGTNFRGDCVAWSWESNSNYKWECLNDGNCARTSRGTHDTQQSCTMACTAGPWYCQVNPSIQGGAGKLASFCIQDNIHQQTTKYSGIAACEAAC